MIICISLRFDFYLKFLLYLCNSFYGFYNINGYLCFDMKIKKGYIFKMYLYEMICLIELL